MSFISGYIVTVDLVSSRDMCCGRGGDDGGRMTDDLLLFTGTRLNRHLVYNV